MMIYIMPDGDDYYYFFIWIIIVGNPPGRPDPSKKTQLTYNY